MSKRTVNVTWYNNHHIVFVKQVEQFSSSLPGLMLAAKQTFVEILQNLTCVAKTHLPLISKASVDPTSYSNIVHILLDMHTVLEMSPTLL